MTCQSLSKRKIRKDYSFFEDTYCKQYKMKQMYFCINYSILTLIWNTVLSLRTLKTCMGQFCLEGLERWQDELSIHPPKQIGSVPTKFWKQGKNVNDN
jgi:hypothetical protein